jgi:hypothetical protein
MPEDKGEERGGDRRKVTTKTELLDWTMVYECFLLMMLLSEYVLLIANSHNIAFCA